MTCGRLGQVARPPKAAAEPLPQLREGIVLVDGERHDPVRSQAFGVLLLLQLFGAAERAAERLGRGVVAHARAAALALEIVRGESASAPASRSPDRCGASVPQFAQNRSSSSRRRGRRCIW